MMKTERSAGVSRAEKLGRRLIRVLGAKFGANGFKSITGSESVIFFPNRPNVYYSFRGWDAFHFGINGRRSFIEGIEWIKHIYPFINIRCPITPYESLDELDIQLSLIGENHD